ncbi:MAG: hypothetical protein WA918_09990 [Erythrobacter sp.]
MTRNDAYLSSQTGEERLKSRRRRLWTFIVGGAVVALIIGMATGMATAAVNLGDVPNYIVFSLIALSVLAFIWFSYRYYARIDELDRLNNLWANTFGIYTYVIVTFVWHILAEAGIVAQVDYMSVFVITLIVTTLAYFARHLGVR